MPEPFPAGSPAYAYINWARWLADCPAGCASAMTVTPGQTTWLCGIMRKGLVAGGCGSTAALLWPDNPDAYMAALANRADQYQNWAPAGHRQTFCSYTPDGRLIAEAYPTGQTPEDLLTEAY
jgi:hypothetical protein